MTLDQALFMAQRRAFGFLRGGGVANGGDKENLNKSKYMLNCKRCTLHIDTRRAFTVSASVVVVFVAIEYVAIAWLCPRSFQNPLGSQITDFAISDNGEVGAFTGKSSFRPESPTCDRNRLRIPFPTAVFPSPDPDTSSFAEY